MSLLHPDVDIEMTGVSATKARIVSRLGFDLFMMMNVVGTQIFAPQRIT